MKPIEVVLDNRLRMRGLPVEVAAELKAAFTHTNPDFGKAARFGRVPRGIPKEFATWVDDKKGEFSLPRGGAKRMRQVLQAACIEYVVSDQREQGQQLPAWYALERELWEHQTEIVDVALRLEQALVRAPTGCGKSTAAAGFIVAAGRWAIVVVPTTGLMRQWVESLTHDLGLEESEIGLIGDGKRRLLPITIALPQSLAKLSARELHQFGTIVYDEVHRAAAPSFFSTIDVSPARFRLGVTADERRKDRKDFFVRDVFGDVVVDIKRNDLIAKGIVLDVEVRMVPTTFEAPWLDVLREKTKVARELVEEGKAISNKLARNLSQEDLESFGKLLEEMLANDERNALITRLAVGAARKNHNTLVFTHRREHAERLRASVAASDPRVGLMLGGKGDESEFELTKQGLKQGTVRVGIGTYLSMGTGIDIPAVNRGIAATPIHTNRANFGQVRGRMCRRGSEDAVLWYVWDERVFGNVPLRMMLRWNNTVNVLRGDAWIPGRVDLEQNGNDEAGASRK